MRGITAASNKPAEFRVHAKGALANGCTREQVQDVLLLVAMYCGVPAAIETNRIAAEIFHARLSRISREPRWMFLCPFQSVLMTPESPSKHREEGRCPARLASQSA